MELNHQYDLSTMSEQEVFDAVCNHLLTQRQRSTKPREDSSPYCAYRGEGGLKCAAGIFIPDNLYLPDMEGTVWGSSIYHYRISENHKGLIRKMQYIHDDTPVDDWEVELKAYAEEYGLVFNGVFSDLSALDAKA